MEPITQNPERLKQIRREANKRWILRHPEEAKKARAEAVKRYLARRPEAFKATQRRYYLKNRERLNNAAKERYARLKTERELGAL